MEREFLVWFCCFLTVFDCVTSRDTKYVKGVVDAKQNYLDTNFESGSLSPWMDNSDDRTAVRWIVEDFWTISPSLRPPPLEPIGSSNRKYLRLERQLRGAFDVAVLQSPFVLCQPGDFLTFSYWIRSRYNQWDNIQVFWSESNGAERLLVDLSASSQIDNNKRWNIVSQLIPIQSAMEIRLTFYGFCATDDLDAIAIDDIKIMTSEFMSTTAITTSPLATTNTNLSTEFPAGNTDASSETTNNEAVTTETKDVTSTITNTDPEGTSDGTMMETTEKTTGDLLTIWTTPETTDEIPSSPLTDSTTESELTTIGDTSETADFTSNEISSSQVTDGKTGDALTITNEIATTFETTETTADEITVTDNTTEGVFTTTSEFFTVTSETSENTTPQELISTQVTDDTTESDLTTSCTFEATVPSTFICPNPNTADELIAAGQCLPYYYRCRFGVAAVEDCAVKGTFFNPGIRGCLFPAENASCGYTAPPTTRPC